MSGRCMALDSAEEFSWLEGLWFDRTGVPELVRIASLSCVGVPLQPIADGGLFVCPGSVASFDSITTLPLEIGDLGFAETKINAGVGQL